MNEKEFSNIFRFTLKQGDVTLCEKVFDADLFNPLTRYSINIREILPKAITRLQIMLSRKTYDTVFSVSGKSGEEDEETIDVYEHYLDMLYKYPPQMRADMVYLPTSQMRQIDEKVIRGVECKIGLYINNNPIVEREFYVNGFNPEARWSVDLMEAVVDIADIIFDQIKRSDIRNMWDDYDLINQMGFSINQIRELTFQKREDLVRRLKK